MIRIACGLAALAFACAAGAQTVVASGGDPNENTIWYADTDDSAATQAAAEFTVNGNASVDQVEFWGAYTSTTTASSSDAYTLNIYKANNGSPGSLVASVGLGNASETATGSLIGSSPEYSYNASFAGIALGAGTYFLGLQRTGGSTSGIWGWESADASAADVFATENSAELWTTTSDRSLAYSLSGTVSTVPEPASFWLLLVGLPFVGRLIRRHGD